MGLDDINGRGMAEHFFLPLKQHGRAISVLSAGMEFTDTVFPVSRLKVALTAAVFDAKAKYAENSSTPQAGLSPAKILKAITNSMMSPALLLFLSVFSMFVLIRHGVTGLMLSTRSLTPHIEQSYHRKALGSRALEGNDVFCKGPH